MSELSVSALTLSIRYTCLVSKINTHTTRFGPRSWEVSHRSNPADLFHNELFAVFYDSLARTWHSGVASLEHKQTVDQRTTHSWNLDHQVGFVFQANCRGLNLTCE